MTTLDVIKQVEEAAKAKASNSTVRYGTLAPGDCHRQGDLYILCLKKVPDGAERDGNAMAQLAPGATQGSRHCVVAGHLKSVTFYTRKNPTALDGPILDAKQRFTIEHPEHGHVDLPAGVYSIHYQRQFAEELKRVAD